MKVLCAIICVAFLVLSPVVFLVVAAVQFAAGGQFVAAFTAGGMCLGVALLAAVAWGVWNIAKNVEWLMAAERKRKNEGQRQANAGTKPAARTMPQATERRAPGRPSPTQPI